MAGRGGSDTDVPDGVIDASAQAGLLPEYDRPGTPSKQVSPTRAETPAAGQRTRAPRRAGPDEAGDTPEAPARAKDRAGLPRRRPGRHLHPQLRAEGPGAVGDPGLLRWVLAGLQDLL